MSVRLILLTILCEKHLKNSRFILFFSFNRLKVNHLEESPSLAVRTKVLLVFEAFLGQLVLLASRYRLPTTAGL